MASRVSWVDLPEELVAEIAKHLESPMEIGIFRLVSKAWFLACPLSPKILSLVLPQEIPIPIGHFDLVPERCVLVASYTLLLHPPPILTLGNISHSKPWMVRVEELNPGLLQIQRPLTHNWDVDLAYDFPMGLNFSQIRVSVAFKGFNLRTVSNVDPRALSHLDANKVVMYSHQLGESPATASNFTAVVLLLTGRLFAVRLSDKVWVPIKFGRVSRFDDVLSFRGSIFVLDRKGRVYRLCCSTLSHTCIVSDFDPNNHVSQPRKHLVDVDDELYSIHFAYSRFKVFKLNEDQRVWEEVHYLGEHRLIFLGPDCGFSSSTRDFPGWRGNSIIYHKDAFRTSRSESQVFYGMSDNPNHNLHLAVFHMERQISIDIVSSGYSDVFWPPPRWLRHPVHRPTPRAPQEVVASDIEIDE